MEPQADACTRGVERSGFYFENIEGWWIQTANTLGSGLTVGRTLNPSQLPEWGMGCLILGPGSDTPRCNPALAAVMAPGDWARGCTRPAPAWV